MCRDCTQEFHFGARQEDLIYVSCCHCSEEYIINIEDDDNGMCPMCDYDNEIYEENQMVSLQAFAVRKNPDLAGSFYPN